MSRSWLESVVYEPEQELSLFERWEAGKPAALLAPLAVRDPAYRRWIVEALRPHRGVGREMVSVGSGNGFVEAELARDGWSVLATDIAPSALELCRAKGLATALLDVDQIPKMAQYDAIYCDGVMGHLWEPERRCQSTWAALGRLGRGGSLAFVVNDLSDTPGAVNFAVRASPGAQFYRPPAATFGEDAIATGRWEIVDQSVYSYVRGGVDRVRELVIARLLVDERVEAKDRAQFS